MKPFTILLIICLLIPAVVADNITETEPTTEPTTEPVQIITTTPDYITAPVYHISKTAIIKLADIDLVIQEPVYAGETPDQILTSLTPGESRKIIDGEITWIIRKGL